MDFSLAPIAERVRAAAADQTPLRIRGGGTKDFHGLALHGEVLDTRGLRGIVSYEPSELVVTVRAGTPLAELEAALAEQGRVLVEELETLGTGLREAAREVAGTLRVTTSASFGRQSGPWKPCRSRRATAA